MAKAPASAGVTAGLVLLTLCKDVPEGGGEGEEFRRILAGREGGH